ncbi:hypothetical protein TSAR_012600 [Trichomalopsis sarcophagae]|uniref:Uncharacterized protein n=1 Tax=Trichomalopsis sarcophagae TaxID=543379 RepID=A0A232EJK0_9HYME|nr:hypothetical protein TSAR_012600 [Trichomalopsis sarcophagae]
MPDSIDNVVSNASTFISVFGRNGTLAGGYYQKGEKEKKKRKKEIRESTGAKNKNGTRKPEEKPSRPDVLIIKADEGYSYADILRKIKEDFNLTVLGNSLKYAKRCQTIFFWSYKAPKK